MFHAPANNMYKERNLLRRALGYVGNYYKVDTAKRLYFQIESFLSKTNLDDSNSGLRLADGNHCLRKNAEESLADGKAESSTNLEEAPSNSGFTLDSCANNIVTACQLSLSIAQQRDMREVIRAYRTEWQSPASTSLKEEQREVKEQWQTHSNTTAIAPAADTSASQTPLLSSQPTAMRVCPVCEGTGDWHTFVGTEDCLECKGTGKILVEAKA